LARYIESERMAEAPEAEVVTIGLKLEEVTPALYEAL